MSRKKLTLGSIGSALVLGLLAVPVNPAFAAVKSGSTEVSCDGVTIKTLTTISQSPSGTFKIQQNSATSSSSSRVFATSANNNSLSTKTVGNGGTATWTGVAASTYTAKAYRSGSANCNGILPGNGNYTLNFTVTSNA